MRFFKIFKSHPFLWMILGICIVSLLSVFPAKKSSIFFDIINGNAVSFELLSSDFSDQTPISVYDTDKASLVTMGMDEYLFGVVAAEMPASFDSEALKAQAVASRTFLVHRLSKKSGCSSHPGADICTSSAHCQAFCSVSDLREKWGELFNSYFDKIKTAIHETTREILEASVDKPHLVLEDASEILAAIK